MARRQPPSSPTSSRLPRLAVTASTPTLPHLFPPPSSDLRISDRLLCAVADVLRIPRSAIDIHHSFEELGGTPQLAEVLRLSCLSWGLDLRTEDIMASTTLAELQAATTTSSAIAADNSKPSTPLSPTQRSPRLSPRDGVESSLGSSTSEVFSLTPKYSSGDMSRSECQSVDSKASKGGGGGSTRTDKEATESLLESLPQVFRAALVCPRAGFFEDRLVAFLVLAGDEEHATTETSEIRIIPQSKCHLAGSQVAALTQLLETSPGTHAIPSMWIILERMPLNADGRPERRKLQTWVQNMNEDLYQQVLSLESQELMQEPSTDVELALQRLVSKVLKVPQAQVGMNFSFSQLGGDEISALEMVVACRTESLIIKPSDILSSDSLAQLAFQTSSKGGLGQRWNESFRESSEGFALSPMQRLYFETSVGGDGEKHAISNTDGSYRFNSSLLLRIKHAGMALEDVRTAVETVVAQHAMLRARFKPGDRGWTQSVAKSAPGAFRFGHQSIRTNEDMTNAIARVQTSIDILHGPTFAAEHFLTDDGQQLLYILAHHLVVDMVSWRVVVHDLDELLQHKRLLSERSMPFRQWNELQQRAIEADEVDTTLPFQVSAGDLDYWNMESRPNTYGDAVKAGFSLSPELTSILQTTCNQVFRTDSADIYLAALVLSFAQTFPDRPVPILWNQEHGREAPHHDSEADIAETVGWFTSLCPVRVDTEAGDDFVNVLRRVKDVRRSIPRRGWPYFASQLLGSRGSAPSARRDWPFEIMFTHAGSLQQLERNNGILEQIDMPGHTLDSQTSDIGSAVGRIALFEVSASVDQGSAKVKFLYNRNSGHQERISQWIQSYELLLLEAIGRLRYRHQELTLSDVPLLNTTYYGLDRLNSDRLLALGLTSAKDVENVFPVTALQQEALISQSQAALSCHNHFTYELVLPGGQIPDGARICNAWEHVVSSCPALRTVFIDSVSVDGLFDQVVLRKCSPRMLFIEVDKDEDPVLSLNALPPLRCNGPEPSHRLTVCRSERSTFVKLEISQALCDTASIDTLMADLAQAYTHGKSVIRAREVSYPGDYLQYLEPTRLAQSLGFWKDRLEGLKPCLFPRLTPSAADNVAKNLSFELDITPAHFDAFCHAHEVNRSAVIRLSWALVLRAYTGDKNVCFGYRCSGRDVPGVLPDGMQTVVGCFENTIVCPISLPTDSPLLSILHAEDHQLSAFLPHHTTSVSEINHAIGLRGEQLFNTSLLFLDDRPPSSSSYTPNLRYSVTPHLKSLEHTCIMSYNTIDNDVSISVMFRRGRLTVHITHRALSLPQLQNLVSAFSRAITIVLAQPESTVGSVDLFTESNREQLHMWEAVDQQEPPAEGTVQNLFLKALKTRPEAPAVCAWDGDFTYRQVSKLSSRLAHQLIDHGVGPGVPVPVVLDKTRWAVVAMLAVLRAGGCVVPIDSEDRTYAEMAVKQLGANVVLATDVIYKAVENLVPEVVLVNDSLLTAAILTSDSPSSRVRAEDPACIILSPCAPKSKDAKGIFFTHSALASAFHAHGKALGLNNESRVMQLSMFGVHTALVEVFATFTHGGCVCIPSSMERIQGFERAVNRMRVTWSYMTPMLARRVNPANVESLGTVCFRTRMLDEDTFAPWSVNKKVLLAYGAPDICPLGISVLEVKDTSDLNLIARPMLGSLWIVSTENNRQLMPIGAVGELVVQSPTLSHKFYPGHAIAVASSDAAAGSTPKIRYFKTGHRARYTDSGSIEFLSSTRDEVVVRGREVPVRTLEQQIRRCLGSGVDVAVEAITTNDGEKTLAVFIEMEHDFEISDNAFRLSPAAIEKVFVHRRTIQSALRSSVQADFIPSIYVPVKKLPVTPSLKVNRRKLQKMVSWMTHAQLEGLSQVANPDDVHADELKHLPLTHVEEHMRAVWSRILGVDWATISGTDVFLKIGGDGFLAARLVIACRHDGLVISIRDVLRGASLTELCQAITTTSEGEPYAAPAPVPDSVAAPMSPQAPADAVTVVQFDEKLLNDMIAPQLGVDRGAIKDFAEASYAQLQGMETAMRSESSGVECIVLNFTGFVQHRRLKVSCEILTEVHPILRTAFATHRRRMYQVVLGTFTPEFQRHAHPAWRLSSATDKALKKEMASAVSLGVPFTKFVLLDSGKQSVLIIRLSRAQFDGSSVSVQVLLRDLKRIYGGTDTVAVRPTYCDFVRSAQLAASHDAIGYWKNLLQDAAMTQVIAHQRPRPLTKTPKSMEREITVTPLSDLGISFDTVLKTAWAMVLATLSASGDVVFGESVEGRHIGLPNGQGFSGLFGPTRNVVPVRVTFSENQITPLDLLRSVHGQRVAGLPFENMGMLDLVERCTSWPYWMRFSTVVRHSYHGENSAPTAFNLESTVCTYSVTSAMSSDVPDLLVSTTQECPDKARVGVVFCEQRVPQMFAEDALRMLCTTIQKLTSAPMTQAVVPSARDYKYQPRHIPIARAIAAEMPAPTPPPPLSPELATPVQNVITIAWTKILNPRAYGVPEQHVREAKLYDIWGSLIPAAQIAEYLTREMPHMGIPGCEGIAVTMEEVIEHPTMRKQMDMLTRKIQGTKGGVGTAQGGDKKKNVSGISMTFAQKSPASWGRSIKRRLTGNADKGHPPNSGPSVAAPGSTSPTRPAAMKLDTVVEGALDGACPPRSPTSRVKSHSRSRSLTHAFSRENLQSNRNGHDDAQDQQACESDVPPSPPPSQRVVPKETAMAAKTVDAAVASRLHIAAEMDLGSFTLKSIQAATANINGLRSPPPPSLVHKASSASLQDEHLLIMSTNADSTLSLPSPRGLSSIGMGLKKMASADSLHEIQPLPRQHTFGDGDVIPEEEEPMDEVMPVLEVKGLRHLRSAVQYSGDLDKESRVAEVVNEDDDYDEYQDEAEAAGPLSPESRNVVIGMEPSRESTAAVTAAGEAAVKGRRKVGNGGAAYTTASPGQLESSDGGGGESSGSRNNKKRGLSHSRKGSDLWLRMGLSSSRQGASNMANDGQSDEPAIGV